MPAATFKAVSVVFPHAKTFQGRTKNKQQRFIPFIIPFITPFIPSIIPLLLPTKNYCLNATGIFFSRQYITSKRCIFCKWMMYQKQSRRLLSCRIITDYGLSQGWDYNAMLIYSALKNKICAEITFLYVFRCPNSM